MNIHLIITKEEQLAIVNALSLYAAAGEKRGLSIDEYREEWDLCFKEDNRGSNVVDNLATKISTIDNFDNFIVDNVKIHRSISG